VATSHVNVGHAPFFDGDEPNFNYWKTCMRIHLKAMGGTFWKVVDEGFVILNETNPTQVDNENILPNAQAMNVIICALCIHEYHRVYKLETAHEIWGKLIEAHEGTSNIKSAKLFICKGKFEKFALLPNEELNDSFSRLNNIVNELKDLKFDVPDVDISHKFLRALPPKYETIVTLLVRSNLKTISPLNVLGEIITHDIFKQSQKELHGNIHEDKKKIMAFKAKTSNDDDHDVDSETSIDDDVALMVEKFKKFMKKKGYHGGYSKDNKSYSKNPFAKKKCFECGEMGHISTNCKNKDEDNSSKKKFEGKKKLFKKHSKKKNGKNCYVEWDSDTSLDSDSSDDDDVKPSKKGLAEIAIKEAPSLFDTPYCLMAKGEPKVNYKFGGRHWVLDSGCTQHMTENGRMFTSIDNEGSECHEITFCDNSKDKVKELGKIVISNDLSISNVLLVESLSYNLLSAAQLCDLCLI
jgi:hypothetical protein